MTGFDKTTSEAWAGFFSRFHDLTPMERSAFVRSSDTSNAVPLRTVSRADFVHRAHDNQVNRLEISRDGSRLVTCSADRSIAVWRLSESFATIEPMNRIETAFEVTTAKFSPDGGSIVSAHHANDIKLWDANSFEPIAELTGHTDWVADVVFASNGSAIASASLDKTVRIFNRRSPQTMWDSQESSVLSQHAKLPTSIATGVWSVDISRDHRLMATGGSDRTVRLIAFDSKEELGVFTGHTGVVFSTAFSASGSLLASGGEDGMIFLWKTRDGIVRNVLRGHQDWVVAVVFSKTGNYLASASYDGTVKLWDIGAGVQIASFAVGVPVHTVTFSPSDEMLVAGDNSGSVHFWRLNSFIQFDH